MRRAVWWGAGGAAAAAVAVALALGVPADPDPGPMLAARHDRLSPAEVLSGHEEGRGKVRRAWFAERHPAPEGVDYRRIERDNLRALVTERTEIRRGLRTAPPVQWVERGSDNQAGSMYTVVRSSDGSGLVAGSALGGVWRAELDGTGWTPHGDGIYGGVHHVVALPPDTAGGPDVLVTSPTEPALVYRSADDGITWDPVAGLPADLDEVRRLVVDADTTVWLVGSVQGDGSVYRSTDAGVSFTEVLDLGAVAGDLWVPRDGSSADVYAVGDLWLYRSTDGGDTWSQQALPEAMAAARLTASEATTPPRLYVASADWFAGTLWASADGGADWHEVSELPDYWEVLTASTLDPDLVAYGGVDLYRSVDGGRRFDAVNTWDEYYADPLNKLHADMMAVTVVPDEAGETWYIGCHGGVYASTDGLHGVRNLSMQGLRVSQYYSVLTDADDPSRVLAGSQDQGLQWAAAAPSETEARFDFEQVISGDYGHIVSTDGTAERVFTVYPGLILTFLDEGGPVPELDWFEFPDDPGIPIWLPFLAPDPEGERDAFLFGANQLWRYWQDGNRWLSEPYSEQSFGQTTRGYLSALAFSPVDPALAVATNNVGTVYRSSDRGKTWTEEGTGPVGNLYYGAAVLASHHDADRWYLGGSGYDGPAVYRSLDGGVTFEPWSEGLPSTLVNDLVELRDGTERVVAATENAVYVRDPRDPAGEWTSAGGDGAPITQYWDAEVLQHENTVRLATYGRGLWDLRFDPSGQGCHATLDADGDGTVCADDCDDADPGSYPGAVERCDGIDNDCDGQAEPDLDGDGAFACDAVADAALADCDDTEARVAPGLDEVPCDGLDNDCDGSESCPPPRVADEEPVGGCGCATPGSPPSMWLLGLLAPLRRR